MKAIIYAGIGLFAAASIYGVADYYTAKKQGTLDHLYEEEETVPAKNEKATLTIPAKTTGNITNAVTEAFSTEKTSSKKKKNKRKAERVIEVEDFSRGRIEEPVIEEQATAAEVSVIPIANTTTTTEIKKTEEITTNEEAVKPFRKISLDKFSRAPLKFKKKAKTKAL